MVGQNQVAERQQTQTYHGDESTLILDDIGGLMGQRVPRPVQEASAEEEQSERNISRAVITQAQPRSSVASIISAIQPDDSVVHEMKEMQALHGTGSAPGQHLSASIDMKTLGAGMNLTNLPNVPPTLNKSTSGIVRDPREIAAMTEEAIARNQQTLTQFFNAEEQPPQLPSEANAAVVGREEDEQQYLLQTAGAEDAHRSSDGNSSQTLNTSEFANLATPAASTSMMAHELQSLAPGGDNSMAELVAPASQQVNHSMTDVQQHNTSSSGNSSSGVLASGSFVGQPGDKDLENAAKEVALQQMD